MTRLERAARKFAAWQRAYPTRAARGYSVTEGTSGTFRDVCREIQPGNGIFAMWPIRAARYHNRHAFGARVKKEEVEQ